jgi:hypothetical protein
MGGLVADGPFTGSGAGGRAGPAGVWAGCAAARFGRSQDGPAGGDLVALVAGGEIDTPFGWAAEGSLAGLLRLAAGAPGSADGPADPRMPCSAAITDEIAFGSSSGEGLAGLVGTLPAALAAGAPDSGTLDRGVPFLGASGGGWGGRPDAIRWRGTAPSERSCSVADRPGLPPDDGPGSGARRGLSAG